MTKTPPITPEQVKKWQSGSLGFFAWLEHVKPRIPSARGGFEIFKIEGFQMEILSQALRMDNKGRFRYQTIVVSLPRRHSKTLLMALIVLWRFSLWPSMNIKVVANSEKQSLSTAFKLVRSIILNTPSLLNQIGKQNIYKLSIEYPALQSKISATTCNIASLYGEKISVGWLTELHAAVNTEAMDVIASSLGDTINSMMLIDSTVDAQGGPLHHFENLAASGEDDTIYCHRTEYADLDEALEKSPSWIDKRWLKSRKKQLLPQIFESQHLNRRGSANNNLFKMSDIERAQEPFKNPIQPEDIEAITFGRKHVCGGGLDRAFGFSLHADSTIWTTVAKVAGVDSNEPDYHILNQKSILFSQGKAIKEAIKEDHERYNLQNTIIESYNCQDIHAWMVESKIPSDLVFANSNSQIPAFTELARIVREGRLHFSEDLKELAKEMETFTYEIKNGQPRFGTQKGHDDRVYSLAWAVYSLIDKELATYELPCIVCHSKSEHAQLCYLRTGDMILFCSEQCETHKRVESMFMKHKGARVDSELSLPQFFDTLVQVKGGKVYQGI